MKRSIKKFISVVLALVIIVSALSASASAFSADNHSAVKECETITLDGVSYEIEESCLNDREITRITNLSTHTQDIIYFDKAAGTVFSNDEPIAYIEELKLVERVHLSYGISAFTTDPYWTFVETKYYKITWAHGAGALAVASAIAAVLPAKGTVAVIAIMGLTALGSIASSATSGTVKHDLYRHTIPAAAKIELLHEWSFIAPTGETYGPFSYMQT